LQAKGESRYSRVIEVPANRGRILDRNGEALAISTPVKSVWSIPGEAHPGKPQLSPLAAPLALAAAAAPRGAAGDAPRRDREAPRRLRSRFRLPQATDLARGRRARRG